MAFKVHLPGFRKPYNAVKNPVFSLKDNTDVNDIIEVKQNHASLLKRRKNKENSPLPSRESSPQDSIQTNVNLKPLKEVNNEKYKNNTNHLLPTGNIGNTANNNNNISPRLPTGTLSNNHLPVINNNNKTINSNNNNRNTKPQLQTNDNVFYKDQEEFCQAMCEARLTDEYDNIQKFLEKIYSSYDDLISAIKIKSAANEQSLNMDLDYVDYLHQSIIRTPKDVQKTLLRSIIGSMLYDQRRVRSVDDLRVYPILLLNPLFNDNSTYGIYAHVLRQVGVLTNKEHHHLIAWFKQLPLKCYTSIIDRIKVFINFKMMPPQLETLDIERRNAARGFGAPWWIPQSVKVLALLNASNEQCNPMLVPRSAFYIRGAESLDLAKEYQSWQSGSPNFSFCQYPFLLSLSAKRLILQKDSETKMLLEARQTLVKKVQKKEAPSMGMLFLNLNIRRKYILEDSLHEISMKQNDLKKKLRIMFTGEPGIDLGGVSKEWFVLLIQKLFNADYGMFKHNDKNQTWWFNASCKDSYQEYNLCGVLIGLAMYNGVNLDIRFPPCLYKKLLNPAIVPFNNPHAPVGIVHMSLSDFKQVFPDLVKGLEDLLEYDGNIEEDFCQNFQVSFTEYGQVITRNLKPKGETVPVTNKNRKEYVSLYIDYMLNKSIYQQFYSFYHGFHSVCASNALLLLRPEEVQTLVIGNPDFKISELEKIAIYDGYNRTDNTIRYFWDTVKEFTPKMQRKLLFFSTGSDRVPVGGIKEMRFKITRVNGNNASNMLPMAHTCFNQLCLPPYKNRKIMLKKLITAIENAEGFGIE